MLNTNWTRRAFQSPSLFLPLLLMLRLAIAPSPQVPLSLCNLWAALGSNILWASSLPASFSTDKLARGLQSSFQEDELTGGRWRELPDTLSSQTTSFPALARSRVISSSSSPLLCAEPLATCPLTGSSREGFRSPKQCSQNGESSWVLASSACFRHKVEACCTSYKLGKNNLPVWVTIFLPVKWNC